MPALTARIAAGPARQGPVSRSRRPAPPRGSSCGTLQVVRRTIPTLAVGGRSGSAPRCYLRFSGSISTQESACRGECCRSLGPVKKRNIIFLIDREFINAQKDNFSLQFHFSAVFGHYRELQIWIGIIWYSRKALMKVIVNSKGNTHVIQIHL